MISALQLKDFWVEELHFIRSAEFSPETGNVDLHVEVKDSKEPADSRKFECGVIVELKPRDPARADELRVACSVRGRFEVHEKASESHLKSFREVNAHAILYGIARGIVAQVTALTQDGKQILPSFNFTPRQQRVEGEPLIEKATARPTVRKRIAAKS